MKFSLKGVVVGLTIVLMLVLNLAPNAQAVDANSNHNEVTVDNVSYADVQELLNDSRIDQGAVRELANSRTSTAADFDSLFALWGVNIKDWPVPLQQVIDFIRQIFGIDRAQDPVHDPDTVPAGEIPGISSRASFTLLCYGEDEVLFDHRAEAKYRGVYSGYLVDSDGSMLGELVPLATYEKGDILASQRFIPRGLNVRVVIRYQDEGTPEGDNSLNNQRVMELNTSNCLNPGS